MAIDEAVALLELDCAELEAAVAVVGVLGLERSQLNGDLLTGGGGGGGCGVAAAGGVGGSGG